MNEELRLEFLIRLLCSGTNIEDDEVISLCFELVAVTLAAS